MSLFDTLLGNTAADASKAAAADTYAKQQAAIGGIQTAGTNAQTQLNTLGNGYQPFVDTGLSANGSLQQLLANPSSVESLPGFQAALANGTKALDHSATANGTLFSGKAGKALQTYGQNLEDQTYNNRVSQLSGLSQNGLGALGQQNATYGQGIQDKLTTDQNAFTGGFQDASTIGQGDVAAANAQAKGLQSLLGAGASILGGALGGGSFGSISKYFSPSAATNNPYGGVNNPTYG